MGWGGISNIPPDFDVFGGKNLDRNIVEEAIRGRVNGLSAAREGLFRDLKRNLLHRDYARYFDLCLPCAGLLMDIENGKLLPEVLRDIIEPALSTAVSEMESVRKDVAQSKAAHRPLQYDALPVIEHLYRKAQSIAKAYPRAAGATTFDEKYREITSAVAEMQSA